MVPLYDVHVYIYFTWIHTMHEPTLNMHLHMHNILVHMCGRSREMTFISLGSHKEKVSDFCISQESSKLEVMFICDCKF